MACNRKNQSTLTADEKARYVAAVVAIKANGTYDQFVSDHVNFMMGAHRGPAFLPWHREYLRRFELALRAVDSAIALPYWDWSVDNSAVSSIWGADFMGGNGRVTDGRVTTGPFAFDAGNWTLVHGPTPDLKRRMAVGAPTLPTPGDVSAALAVTPYDIAPWNRFSVGGFRNTVEGWIAGPQMHNRVHVWVGGSMEPMSSPNDPVFFLHHCFVDKLWADWQALHPGESYQPVSGAGTGHNLNDPMEPWFSRGETVTPASVLNHKALGYGYDTDPDCAKRIVKEIKDFKEGKREKIEVKEFKERKLEKNELKERKPEKLERKELVPETGRIPDKHIREKQVVEGPQLPQEIPFKPSLDERLESIETGIDELRHFIRPELRPDLGKGALRGEPDLRAFLEGQEDEANLVRMEKLNKDLEKLAEQPPDEGPRGTHHHHHGEPEGDGPEHHH